MFLNVAITIIWLIPVQLLSEHWDYLALKWVILAEMPRFSLEIALSIQKDVGKDGTK